MTTTVNTTPKTPAASAPKMIPYNVAKTFGFGPVNAEIGGFDKPSRFSPAVDANYELRKDLMMDILAWWLIGDGEGLYLTGPSGSGKSSLIRQICGMLNLPLQHMVGHNRLEFPEMVTTVHIVNGNTVVSYGPLARAMKYGHVFLLDEIDLIDPSTNAALNEIIQGRPLTIPETGEVIVPHPLFKFIATGNTRGSNDSLGVYQGTTGQNMAFMDRFWVVEVGYAEKEVELKILQQIVNAPQNVLEKMIEVANAVRDAFMGNSQDGAACEITFSTRTLVRWAKGAAYFKPLAKQGKNPMLYSLDLALCNRATKETRAFIQGMVTRVFGE